MGLLFALPIVGIVVTLVGAQPDSLFNQGALSNFQWLIVLSLPFIVALLSFATALLTAFRKLRSF